MLLPRNWCCLLHDMLARAADSCAGCEHLMATLINGANAEIAIAAGNDSGDTHLQQFEKPYLFVKVAHVIGCNMYMLQLPCLINIALHDC